VAEDFADGDAQLADVMTHAAKRISAGDRAYEVCTDAMGALVDLIGKAHHDGAAYLLWAEISDLFDSPWGPRSESACSAFAAAASADWLSVARSPEAVASYFERWHPGRGSAWLAHESQLPGTSGQRS
jgi:hypothetical protein